MAAAGFSKNVAGGKIFIITKIKTYIHKKHLLAQIIHNYVPIFFNNKTNFWLSKTAKIRTCQIKNTSESQKIQVSTTFFAIFLEIRKLAKSY